MARGFVSRRVSQRAPLQAEIAISLETGGSEPVIASASNISAGGLQLNILQGKARLPAEERLELVFDLPNLGETKVQGEIIYFNNSVDSENNKVVCYGIRFLDLSQETWNIINAYCHGLLDAQQPETATTARPVPTAPTRAPGKGHQAAHALKQEEIDQLLKNLLPQDGKATAPARPTPVAPPPSAPTPSAVPPPPSVVPPPPSAVPPPPAVPPPSAVPPPLPPAATEPPLPVVETQSSLPRPSAPTTPPPAATASSSGETLVSNSLIDMVYGGGTPAESGAGASEVTPSVVLPPLGATEPPAAAPPPPTSGPELVKSTSMASMDQTMIDQIIRSLQKDQPTAKPAPPVVPPSLVPERPPDTGEKTAESARPMAGAPPELEAAVEAAAAAVEAKFPQAKLQLQDGRVLTGKIENLNFGGLMVRLAEPVPLNLGLQIQLMIEGESLTEIPGTSTNCEALGAAKDEYLIGVFFESMDDTHFTKLRQLVAKFKPTS